MERALRRAPLLSQNRLIAESWGSDCRAARSAEEREKIGTEGRRAQNAAGSRSSPSLKTPRCRCRSRTLRQNLPLARATALRLRSRGGTRGSWRSRGASGGVCRARAEPDLERLPRSVGACTDCLLVRPVFFDGGSVACAVSSTRRACDFSMPSRAKKRGSRSSKHMTPNPLKRRKMLSASPSRPLALTLLGLGLAACGAQAAPTYRGEPLATLHGTVTSSNSALTPPVDAALVWSPSSLAPDDASPWRRRDAEARR